VADLISASALHTAAQAITVALPAIGVSKTISWTLAGPVKQRWIELTKLTLAPGQSLTARLDNGGFALALENNGPTTTAELRVQAGPGASPIAVGTITLDGNSTATFTFDAPHTALMYIGGTPGRNGWLLSPVTITLTARDYSSKGIAAIAYSTDGVAWTRYDGPFVLALEGVTTLFYRATDNDGNQEGAQTRVFQIDTQPPQSRLSIGLPRYSAGPPPVIPSITPLTLSATDGASGVQSVSFRSYLQDSTPPDFTTVAGASTTFKLLGDDGRYIVEHYATDIAGNVEVVQRQEIKLGNARAVRGLQALYTFQEGSGSIVQDLAGVGDPLDLHISDPAAVQWTANGLQVDAPALIASSGPATKLIAAAQATNELTIEAWIHPANPRQHGIQRIVTMSGDAANRNVALVQMWDRGKSYPSYAGRLRTTATSVHGNQGPSTPHWHVTRGLTHLVYTRDASGTARLYVNGDMKDDSITEGNLSNWDSEYRLALANELSNDRPWRGSYQLVAVYSRALSPAEVNANYLASPSGDGPAPHLRILARYSFNEGSGATVHDRSGVGVPLDLTISDPEAISWLASGLRVTAPTRITSGTPANKLIDGSKLSGELTIEAWVQSETTTSARPASIVGIARDAYNRNVVIEQGRWQEARQNAYTASIRTDNTLDGAPLLHTNDRTVSRNLSHLVLTRDAAGAARLYLDGELQGHGRRTGSLAVWTTTAELILANAPTGELPWLGTYRAVTISNQAWSSADVRTSFKEGPKLD